MHFNIIIIVAAVLWNDFVSPQQCNQVFEDHYKDENLCFDENIDVLGQNHICSDWCNYTHTQHEVVNSDSGLVRIFTSAAPYHCNHTNYLITLQVAQVEQDECGLGQLDHVFEDHSELGIAMGPDSTACVNGKNSIDFEYIFTGCYRIVLRPLIHASTQQSCYTSPFMIKTRFPLKAISYPLFKALSNRRTMITSFYWDSTFTSDTLLECVEVRLDQVTTNMEMTCFLDRFRDVSQIANENCSCKWIKTDSLMELKCYFNNLETGDYRISFMAHDPRCMIDTVWTKHFNDSPPHCIWSNNYTFTATNGTGQVQISPSDLLFYLHWITGGVVCFVPLSIMVFLIINYYKKPSYQRDYKYGPVKIELPKYSGKTKILLLYPRDCQPFMDAMNCLRKFLNNTGKFEVLDAFDPDQYENVATHINIWGLSELSCPSTKVVLVASWCSLKFYRSLISKSNLSYKQPEAFDGLFTLNLNSLFQHKEPYKKVFVVRLDCNNAMELYFEHLAKCRVFTLPQCIDSLIGQLLEIQSECRLDIEKDSTVNGITKLKESISIYAKYLRENPDYLDTYLIKHDLRIK